MPHISLAYQQQPEYGSEPFHAPESFRSPTNAPLRKLTVDLIKTYRKINEVRFVRHCVCGVCVYQVLVSEVVCKMGWPIAVQPAIPLLPIQGLCWWLMLTQASAWKWSKLAGY